MARSDPLRTAADAPRVPRRRPPLPGGRAVVGGLLVTVAAIGVFAAYTGATQRHGSPLVTVARPVPGGYRLTADDLRVEQLDLPGAVAAQGFASVGELDGAVTLAPLGADELVQRSAILEAGASPSAPASEFSFAVDQERALNGSLRSGEVVDVLATYGTGADAYTMVVARRAPVLDVASAAHGTIGSGGKVVLTLSLASPEQILAVAHASEVAAVTVVRATRATDTDTGSDVYTPSGPAAAAASARRGDP